MNSYKKFANQKVGTHEFKLINKILLTLEKEICEKDFRKASINYKINRLRMRAIDMSYQRFKDEIEGDCYDYMIKKQYLSENPNLLVGIEIRHRLFDIIKQKTNELNELIKENKILMEQYNEMILIVDEDDE
jgi:hypothetical protein